MRKGLGYRISVVVLSIVTFVLAYAIISFAADADAPAGSYKKSCKSIVWDDDDHITSAKCKRMNGTWNNSASLTMDCTGDRENCNGNLRCTGVDLPSGNYKNSCFCCYKKYKLDINAEREIENVCCLCKQSNGKYNTTETCTPTSCASPKQIQNINGTLSCK